ncbi:hypothetical protein ScPMuIL_007380 [Solemya velum]
MSKCSRGRGRGRRQTPDGWEEQGGYMQAKRQKLQTQYGSTAPRKTADSEQKSEIFKGVAIYVNGYTKPSSDELKYLMTLHGGQFEHYLFKSRVTHVIATNLPDSKVLVLRGQKVIKPQWITDSIKEGRLLSYIPYQLYTSQSKCQPGLKSSLSEPVPYKASSFPPSLSTTSFQDSSDQRVLEVEDDTLLAPQNLKPGVEGDIESLANRDENRGQAHEQNQTNVVHHSPSKAGDPTFLSDFYGNSRLHHLSTWKVEYKDYVAKLQKEKGDNYPGRDKLRLLHQEKLNILPVNVDPCPPIRSKVIMHIDMDCFFVSVGLRKRPDLRGKPIAVTHSRGRGGPKPAPGSDLEYEMRQWKLRRDQAGSKRSKAIVADAGLNVEIELEDDIPGDESGSTTAEGVPQPMASEPFHSMAEIASCSYEARKAGVKNGMLMGTARQLCPALQTIPYDFEDYKAVSRVLYDTVASYTHDIEAVSCDEMLVDCTDILADTGADPLELSSLLRKEIYEQTGCTASAGIATNILLAKMCTRQAKPNGQFYLSADNVDEFIRSQSIKDIPSVGWSLTKKLNNMGIFTCGNLQKSSLATLQKEFGPKTGQSLYKYCRGEDYRPIKMDQERKSVSAEVNYGIRFTKESEADKFLSELSGEVHTRLEAAGMKGKTITLKVMVRKPDAPKETAKFLGHGICTNVSKSVTLPAATDDATLISKECLSLLRQIAVPVCDLRGIGIQVQKLEPLSSKPGLKSNNQSILDFTIKHNQIQKVNQGSPDKTSENGSSILGKNGITGILAYIQETDSPSKAKDSSDVMGGEDDLYIDMEEEETLVTAREDDVDDYAFRSPAGFLLDELSRRKTAKRILPPLPELPSFSTPPESGIVRHINSPRPSENNNNATSEDYFPSPSQIDPGVLKELPRNVREQIEKEIKNRQSKKKEPSARRSTKSHSTTSIISTTMLAAPGCSHWPDKEKSKSEGMGSMPSASQIDPDVLRELPCDIREQIQEEMSKEKMSSVSKSVKLNEPNTAALRRKSKTGRIDLLPSPSQVHSCLLWTTTPSVLLGWELSPRKVIVRGEGTPVSKSNLQPTVEIEEDTSEEVGKAGQETITDVSGDNMPSLCGAVRIGEVRTLLKEWLTSTTEPEVEDEEVIVKYIQDLIQDLNLEQVDLVIKCLYRNIKYLDNYNWWEVLRKVIQQTQAVLRSLYGADLKLTFQIPQSVTI